MEKNDTLCKKVWVSRKKNHLTWYGCYTNQKKVMGFRGGTIIFCWVNKSPRPLLLILEVKREKMKRPPGTGEINMEEELSQDERKPAAIANKNPSVKPSAIPHEKPSTIPPAIPRKKSSSIPQEDAKNDDDIAVDKRKPAAI